MSFIYKTILIFTVIALSPSLAQCQRRRVRGKPNPMAVLQNILSPSNTDGALQLLKFAAAKAKSCGNPRLTEEVIIPNGMLPKPFTVNNVLVNPNQIQQIVEVPQRIGYQNIPVTSQKQVIQEVILPETYRHIIEVPRPKIPVTQNCGCQPPVQYMNVAVNQNCGCELPVQYKNVAVNQNCGCQTAVLPEKCGCYHSVPPCVTPAPMINPFLPAASPVSAIAPPVSTLLPPANVNQCRCNFLRKIPIPPPTL